MSTLQGIPTQHGISILKSNLKQTAKKFQLIGALTHNAPTASLSVFHTDTIEASYYDDNGVLTFVFNLPIERHFNEYLYQIKIVDTAGQSIVDCQTPVIALAKGIGGMVTLKAAVSGQAGQVIFKHNQYVTETELLGLHFPNLKKEFSDKYLGKNSKAADSGKLDGKDSSAFSQWENVQSGTCSTGWVTIATAAGARGFSEVYVWDNESSDHAFMHIEFVRSYRDTSISIVTVGGHAKRITGARVIANGDDTYGEKRLQVYVTVTSVYNVRLKDSNALTGYSGISPVKPELQNLPSGWRVENAELTGLNESGGGMDTTGTLNERGQRVFSPNNKPTAADVGALTKADMLAMRCGEIGYFDDPNPRAGWITLDGGDLSRTTDALLWAHAQRTGLLINQATKDSDKKKYAAYWGTGDGSTTFTRPNLHIVGGFVRATPLGVAHGAYQGDAIREIQGDFGNIAYQKHPAGNASGVISMNNKYGQQIAPATTTVVGNGDGFDFKASRVVPTASENRPHSINYAAKIHRGWM